MASAALMILAFVGGPATGQTPRTILGCALPGELPRDVSLQEMERRCFGANLQASPPTPSTPPAPASPQDGKPQSATTTDASSGQPRREEIPTPSTSAPVAVTPAPAAPTPPPERRFTMIEGFDIDGQDFDQRRNVDLRACLVACRDSARCSAFAYDKWNRMCFLKHTNPGVFRREPKAIVAVNSTARPVLDASRPVIIQRFQGMIFHDAGYETLRVSSYEQCSEACERQERCEAVSYFASSRQCKLIARPGEPFRNQPGVISGIKRQMPGN
jgi:hypothetical protein